MEILLTKCGDSTAFRGLFLFFSFFLGGVVGGGGECVEYGDFAGRIVGIFCAVLFGHCHCHSKSLIKRTPTDSVNVAHVTGGQRGGWEVKGCEK